MLCCVVTVRLVLYSSVPFFYDRQTFTHFERSTNPYQVVYELRDVACTAETETLCYGTLQGNWRPGDTCTTDVWGVPFGSILRMNEASNLGSQSLNCSVLTHTDVVQEGLTLVERERKAAVDKMTTIFRTLLHTLVVYRQPFDSSEPFALPWRSIVSLYIRRLYCLFVYDDNPKGGWEVPGKFSAWKTVIMSDSTLWTEDAFFDLLAQVVEKIKIGLSRSHDDLITRYNDTEAASLQEWVEIFKISTQELDPCTQIADLLEYIDTAKNDIAPKSFAMCPFLPGYLPKGIHTKIPHTLFDQEKLDDCMLSYHFEKRWPVFSTSCREAMTEAPAKIAELQMEDHGGFLLFSKLTFLGISVASCLVLYFLVGTRQRLEKRLERRRTQLQQELNDPILRNSLQLKPGSISEEERRTLLSRLETKVTHWDSKTRALNLSRLYIRRFRWLVIFTMAASTVVYLSFHIFHVSSMPEYLNTLAMSTVILAASYCSPTEDSAEDESQSSEETIELVHAGMDMSIPLSAMEIVTT